jgi:hypothetical protein
LKCAQVLYLQVGGLWQTRCLALLKRMCVGVRLAV